MSMRDLEKAITLIRRNEDAADFEGPRSPELVAAAENELELVFPPTYRKFLLEMGCGDIAGLEIYGLIDDNFEDSSIPDAVWVTLDERKASALASNLVLVAADDDGGYFALDTAQAGEGEECPVIRWHPSQPRTPTVAPDFGAFLLREVESALDEG